MYMYYKLIPTVMFADTFMTYMFASRDELLSSIQK